ncbi:hypothetical protein CLV59_102273 [Chitinophaga dinghuensis]|uniref:Tetratricopeptide repeat protein n=1 Tax=Chitinophaga dinghuensis TaxID=1539050 RepID=A0A327W7X6_9BACT|nr:hypothetical protein [Chitinophaga dinghuensis]RAJ85568.1 hypothetical protein CLV59_102273 [Chitinophaga dinghuensis]
MRRVFYLSLLILFPLSLSAQNYYYLLAEGDSLLKAGNYKLAAEKMDTAYRMGTGRMTDQDFLQFARCTMKTGDLEKAYLLLQASINFGYTNMQNLEKVAELQPLRNDSAKWANIRRQVVDKRRDIESWWDKPLKIKLDSIYDAYKHLAVMADSIKRKEGLQSPQIAAIERQVKKDDSVYMKTIIEILSDAAFVAHYPSVERIGKKGNELVWMLLQRADYQTQQKYWPEMAVFTYFNKSEEPNLAKLSDEMCVHIGQKQHYGCLFVPVPGSTNEFQFLDIEDVEHVNERRNSKGLPPLELFARKYNIRLPAGFKP